jgi:hypothetical protein
MWCPWNCAWFQNSNLKKNGYRHTKLFKSVRQRAMSFINRACLCAKAANRHHLPCNIVIPVHSTSQLLFSPPHLARSARVFIDFASHTVSFSLWLIESITARAPSFATTQSEHRCAPQREVPAALAQGGFLRSIKNGTLQQQIGIVAIVYHMRSYYIIWKGFRAPQLCLCNVV